MSGEDEFGGHAFPSPETEENYYQSGMTLRDYFAAQALPALMRDTPVGAAVVLAYLAADAMLKEREK